jgi:hypothetical protein
MKRAVASVILVLSLALPAAAKTIQQRFELSGVS